MTRVLLIGFAGALGTLVRYGVGVWAGKTLGAGFPYGTMIVNVSGCFLIALVGQLAIVSIVSPTLRITLTTGFMGGLTTYSSFNYETTKLFITDGAAGTAALNIGVTTLGCFVMGLAGIALARALT